MEPSGRRSLDVLTRRYLAERHSRGQYNDKSVRVIRGRLDSLATHFGARPVNHLTRQAVERWLGTLAHLAPASRAAYLASVRVFGRWLVDHGHLKTDPCLGMERIRRPKSVPRAQSRAAIAALLAECVDSRDVAIIALELGLGLRRIEVARACWEHYDPVARLLLVRGKAGHERELPVIDRVVAAIEAVRVRGNTGPIIRSHTTGLALTPDTIGRRVTMLMRRAGIKRLPYDGVSGHALRHTAASDVLDACGDLRIVQAMLGHGHLASTSIYLRRANLGQMREAMEDRLYVI